MSLKRFEQREGNLGKAIIRVFAIVKLHNPLRSGEGQPVQCVYMSV
jgi:hypothetical protein